MAGPVAVAEPELRVWRDDLRLAAQDLLQPAAKTIFRLENGQELRLHRHQKEAIEAARTGKSYVLTTGTGSGKSLAYIIPIVDQVLRPRPRAPTSRASRRSSSTR